jgi:NTP pyrophosphatase (non-canonical NTP hydrolase)
MNVKETLTILSEESAEVIQACSKLIRFGPYDEDNVAELEKELGDVMAMILVLDYYGYVSTENITENVEPKLKKLKKYSKIRNLNKIIKNL